MDKLNSKSEAFMTPARSALTAFSRRLASTGGAHSIPAAGAPGKAVSSGGTAARVGNPAPTKSSSSNNSSNNKSTMCLVALCETRQREVGVASFDLRSGRLKLSQFSDAHSYVHTTTSLLALDPAELIIPHTQEKAEMTHLLGGRFPDAAITLVDRKYFSENQGLLDLRKLAIPDFIPSLDRGSQRMWLCLASANALLKYIQHRQGIIFAPGGLHVTFDSADAFAALDAESVKHLEIVANSRAANSRNTLFSVLNHTKTSIGARQLKMALLQPLKRRESIMARLDVVEYVRLHPKILADCQTILAQCVDVDKILYNLRLVHAPNNEVGGPQRCFQTIKSIAGLKNLLEWAPRAAEVLTQNKHVAAKFASFKSAVGNAKQLNLPQLLEAVVDSLQAPAIENLRARIGEVINPDTNYRTNVYHLTAQLAFAVKPNISGLLDVARKTYSETMDDIHDLTASYRTEFGLPKLKLQFNQKRGHFLVTEAISEAALPPIFIQACVQKKRVTCNTEELAQLSYRNQQSLQEILFLTDRVVKQLHLDIRGHAGVIYKISDAIGLLDFFCSLGQYASGGSANGPMTRPELSNDVSAPIVIHQGRHPIAEAVTLSRYDPNDFAQNDDAADRTDINIRHAHTSARSFVPNDVFCAQNVGNFQIITGPNMSGKTTQLTQLGTLIVLAQIGSFIPAKFASFRIADRLFTRLGTSDSIERNTSTFAQEMKEVAFILQNTTPCSVILIDELGRGTSSRDGLAITWAIAEHLLQTSAYSFLVTHYHEVCKLQNVYANVRNFNLGQARKGPGFGGADQGLQFSHVRQIGALAEHSYGIDMAAAAGIDQELIRDAKMMLAKRRMNTREAMEDQAAARAHQTVLGSAAELLQRIEALRTADTAMRAAFLAKVQNEARAILRTLDQRQA